MENKRCSRVSSNFLFHPPSSDLCPAVTRNNEDNRFTPFRTLYGEVIEYLVHTSEGIMVLTNYRLYFQLTDQNSYYNIPLGLIEKVEIELLVNLRIICKHARTFRFTFAMSVQCSDWQRRIQKVITPKKSKDNVFAFAYFVWVCKELGEEISLKFGNYSISSAERIFKNEVERMAFDVKCGGSWRISSVNAEYKFCNSYPRFLLTPASINDSTLERASNFRTSRRVPAVVWRHRVNGAVIARCSQPEVGWLGWRSSEDEELLKAIADSCAKSKEANSDTESKLLILDARSYTAAVANRARGGGCECSDYYPNCEIKFLNLPNIHSVRKSFDALKALCAMPLEQPGWYSALENTKWLYYISGLLTAAVTVVKSIEQEACPVLVHCSDGWDRTPQIVSLAQLLLDPYYRTVKGFRVLIEREWLEFGHKFSDRGGFSEDVNERSPIFLQWLDTIQNLVRQFPCAFEFSTSYLVKLALHTYSNLFGTFLCNSNAERFNLKLHLRTFSIWKFLEDKKFRNHLFSLSQDQVLWPECHVRYLDIWRELYLNNNEKNYPKISSCTHFRKFGETSNNLTDFNGMPYFEKEEQNDKICVNIIGNDNPVLNEKGIHTEANENKIPDAATPIGNHEINENIHPNSVGKPELPSPFSIIETNYVSIGLNNDVVVSDHKEDIKSNELSCPHSILSTFCSHSGNIKIMGNQLTNSANKSDVQLVSPIQPVLPQLDPVDGLAPVEDQVQTRLQEMEIEHESKMLALEKELDTTRTALLQQTCYQCSQGKNVIAVDGVAIGENPQDDDTSICGTDGSWVAVDERIWNLWIPDEVISNCMSCDSQFWFGCRKHHCRKCGKIFCADCSKYTVALPEDQMYLPVRVCKSCYYILALERSQSGDEITETHVTGVKIVSSTTN